MDHGAPRPERLAGGGPLERSVWPHCLPGSLSPRSLMLLAPRRALCPADVMSARVSSSTKYATSIAAHHWLYKQRRCEAVCLE